MGCFSYCCLGCGFSLLPCEYGNDRGRYAWMTEAVAITPRNQVMHGGITHYGGGFDGCSSIEYFQLYHRVCWVLCGMPKAFKKCSPFAFDQGFLEESVYPPRPPVNKLELNEYKKRWSKYEQSFYDVEP